MAELRNEMLEMIGSELYQSRTENQLTKREQFAVAALQGMLANEAYCENSPREIVDDAVMFAELLEEKLS